MTRLVLLMALLSPLPAAAQAVAAPPSRAEILAGARDVMLQARYATLITVAADGQPQARIVDPLAPADEGLVVWMATNPLTRKVGEIQRNPRVTLLYFDTATASYVTVIGRAAVVTDAAETAAHWKDEWASFYPLRDGKRDVTLIRLTPIRLEIVSVSRNLVGDPDTWLPLSVTFP